MCIYIYVYIYICIYIYYSTRYVYICKYNSRISNVHHTSNKKLHYMIYAKQQHIYTIVYIYTYIACNIVNIHI